MMNKPTRHMLGILTAAAMIAGGCTSGSDDAAVDFEPVASEPLADDSIDGESLDGDVEEDFVDAEPVEPEPVAPEPIDTEPVDTEPVDTDFVEGEPDEPDSVETDPAAEEPNQVGVRDDVECTAESLDDTGDYEFVAAYFVVGGELGETCFGDDDGRLREAWDTLATITPTGQLADLGLFGAFSQTTAQAEDTLAFVNSLDADGSLFQMSVNVDAYGDDPVEARLTMAHEFSHVFTAIPSQLDRSDEAFNNCTTYDNGEGCYTEDSIMAQWIELFWGGGLIDEIDPDVEPTAEAGTDRCNANAGFLGPYAASSPEEDFAESFGAYVFDVEDVSAAEQLRLDWIDAQPGLAEFRDRALAAGLTPVPNNFEICGQG